VAARLNAAGHTRGEFMNTMMALRILSMAHVLTPRAGAAVESNRLKAAF
jgi:hypothetical protein